MESHFSRLYGVNFNSVFNELKYFNVIGGMVPDIMHDLCEGIIPKITLLLLKHCIEDNSYFDLEKLNHIIDGWIQHMAAVLLRNGAVLCKAKVHHSMAISRVPLTPWMVLLKKRDDDSDIITAHCKCVAG